MVEFFLQETINKALTNQVAYVDVCVCDYMCMLVLLIHSIFYTQRMKYFMGKPAFLSHDLETLRCNSSGLYPEL